MDDGAEDVTMRAQKSGKAYHGPHGEKSTLGRIEHGGNRREESDSRDAAGAIFGGDGDCVSRPGTGEVRGHAARNREGLRLLRGVAGRSGDRRHLQSSAESASHPVDRESRRGRQARAVREAAEHDGGRGREPASGAGADGGKNRRSLHDPQLYAMAADGGAAAVGAHRRVARR